MSVVQDQEFSQPIDKSPNSTTLYAPPSSKLSIVSLVFGIASYSVLPVMGPLVAIVTGHAALGEIRDSSGRLGGRSMARVGLWLGYFQVVLILIAIAVVVGLLIAFGPAWFQELGRVETSRPGVKMVNELRRADFKLIENSKIDVKQDEILACYNSGAYTTDPELALLTTSKLIYLKEGRTTEFALKEIKSLMDDKLYRASYDNNLSYMLDGIYYIEVQSNNGQRMRILIRPSSEGGIFFDSLNSAAKGAGPRIQHLVSPR